MRTHRRTVAALAATGVNAARELYQTVPSDTVRVAALVEISAAAAALARTVVKLRHLDPDLIAPHVSDRTDLRAVLGRGQWLPTMVRHVPAPTASPVDLDALVSTAVPARSIRRRIARRKTGAQLALFADGGEH
ncbi:hypothetical protein ABT297_26995 [Dactylosporangium sp. NPDC000555]|uniref:hypothetical protein n=1 Tax=Dactylosporangium sp. NPDC000555 TaxID=3154260 RepID=UPI00332DAD05